MTEPKKVFQIKDGAIFNVVMQPHDFEPDGQVWVASNDENGIGDLYNSETGEFTRPEPPAPIIVVPETLSYRQFFQQLAVMSIITENEAVQAVSVRALPQVFESFIASLPSDQQFNARMLLTGSNEFNRSHPLTATFGEMLNYDSEAIDSIWINGAQL